MNLFRAAFLLLVLLGPNVMVHAQITDGVCQPENIEIVCGNDLDPSGYTITFDLINNSAFDLQKLVIPGTVGGVTISPNIYTFPVPIPPGGVASGIAFQVSGGTPGEQVCLPFGGVSIDPTGGEFHCCGSVLCVELPICEILFIRGDSNADGSCDIGDAVNVLTFLFGGGACPCADACDCNDDGQVNIADAICKLSFLFSGGPPPPTPHPSCGSDPTADSLGCLSFPPCN